MENLNEILELQKELEITKRELNQFIETEWDKVFPYLPDTIVNFFVQKSRSHLQNKVYMIEDELSKYKIIKDDKVN